MGRYYALAQGKDEAVAAAIEGALQAAGPGRSYPDESGVGRRRARRQDRHAGRLLGDQRKPTGSKDPFALRRAALGVIRIVLENGLRLPLLYMFRYAQSHLDKHVNIGGDLLAFFADRLKVYLRDKGARHDLIDAVFALEEQDDLLMVVRRVEALASSIRRRQEPARRLQARRQHPARRGEEGRAGALRRAPCAEPSLDHEEHALAAAIDRARNETQERVRAEDFEGAMQALREIARAGRRLFDNVTVNADDPRLRTNRLQLLNELRAAMHEVAGFLQDRRLISGSRRRRSESAVGVGGSLSPRLRAGRARTFPRRRRRSAFRTGWRRPARLRMR